MKISFALYDSRYIDDEDAATCYTFCDSLKEAIKEKREDWPDAVIVKHTSKKVGKNKYEIIHSEIIN